MARPCGASSSATRRSRAAGSPPIPMFPSASSAVVQLAGPRDAVEHVAQHDQRARGPGQVNGIRRDVNAEGGDAALGQGHGQAARSGADIERGALAAVQDRFVAGAFVEPAVHREAACGCRRCARSPAAPGRPARARKVPRSRGLLPMKPWMIARPVRDSTRGSP